MADGLRMELSQDKQQPSPPDDAAVAATPPFGWLRRLPTLGRSWHAFYNLRRGIGLRLMTRVLLVSSVVTLILTSLQFYLDYQRDVGGIETRLDEIGTSYIGGISDSLWSVDEGQLRAQLAGIVALPAITSAAVQETNSSVNSLAVVVGKGGDEAGLSRDYPIMHVVNGTDRRIGTLHIEATLADVNRVLLRRLWVVLLSQGAKTFLLSAFILYIVHRLITRHLGVIADFIRQSHLYIAGRTLTLQRPPLADPDELEEVAIAINTTANDLQAAYSGLRARNEELKRDIQTRQEIERALVESEQRMRDYAETAFDWFWETGLDHRFTRVPDRLIGWGIEPTQRIGVGRWEFATDVDDEAEKWRDHFTVLEAHQPFRDFRYRTARGDGTVAYISTSGKPIFDELGNFVGYRGVSSDVTAVVIGEQQLHLAQERQLAFQALKIEAEEERLRLLQRIIAAQEEERLRITRDLHDQTGQDLTGLSLGLKGLEPMIQDARGLATLAWLQSLTAQIGSNLHRTAWELRPASLNDIGLLRSLETYTSDWAERFGIRVDFQASDITRRFSDDIETAVYRAVQEALTNVLKHAAASTVSVILEYKDGTLQVIIEDDGRGFNVEERMSQGRLGLAGIGERLSLVKGALSIDSTIGTGTTLYIRIPVFNSAVP